MTPECLKNRNEVEGKTFSIKDRAMKRTESERAVHKVFKKATVWGHRGSYKKLNIARI